MLEDIYDNMEDYFYKEYEKLWKHDLTAPISFKDVLNALTKDELTKIRQNLDLKGLSALNKSELVNRLGELIPAGIGEALCHFDRDRYSIFKRMIARGGYIRADDMDYKKLNYFREHGLAFTGWMDDEKVLAMPVEIMEAFKDHDTFEYKKIVDRNTLLIKLVKGMLFYYGTVNLDFITKKLEEYTKEKCDIIDVLRLLFDSTKYYIQIEHTNSGFKDFRVMYETWVNDEQRSREDLPYYNFTKEELLRAGEDNYIEKTPQINDFSQYLKSYYDIEYEEIDEFLDIINLMINNDEGIGEIIKELQKSFEIDTLEQMQMISAFIMEIHNNTRLWILKGHKPREIITMQKNPMEDKPNIIDIKTRKKIGRNDPCPCGSGKKYKKCCGN